jgi:hypothetical protein
VGGLLEPYSIRAWCRRRRPCVLVQSCSRLHQHPGLRLLAKKRVWLAAAAEQQCASTQIRSTTHQLHGTQPPATSGGLAVLSTPHASALNTSYLPATVTSMRHVALMTLLALPSLFADRKHDDSSGIASLHDDVTRPQPVERQPTARRQYIEHANRALQSATAGI